MQRHFGLNIDDLGSKFSAWHLADCLACMPRGALLAAIDERTEWTLTDVLLHTVLSVLCGKQLPYPWEKPKRNDDLPELEGLPLDDFVEWYSRALVPEGGE